MLRRVSCALQSASERRKFPIVVMPSKPWSTTKASTASNAQQQQQESTPTTASPNEQDERVLELGRRVKLLRSSDAPPSPMVGAIDDAESNAQLDAVAQMMSEQQRERDLAEQLLRGGGGGADAPSTLLSPELEWANRVLRESSGDSSLPSSSSAVCDPAAEKRAAMLAMMDMMAQAEEPKSAPSPSSEEDENSARRQQNDVQCRFMLDRIRAGEELSSSEEVAQLVDWIDSFVPRKAAQPVELKPPVSTEKSADDALAKQIAFSHALRDAASLFDRCGFARNEWFLACGTALGCVREKGRFIPHDTDIDLGIFYPERGSETVDAFSDKILRLVAETSIAAAATGSAHQAQQQQQQPTFICFETLGSVHPRSPTQGGGFQVRLLHVPTRVPVDVNVHYPSADASAWWFSMFYIDKETGRYRPDLQGSNADEEDDGVAAGERRCVFTSAALSPSNIVSSADAAKMLRIGASGDSDASSPVFCPSTAYFDEYFGVGQWQTPRKYSYEEALDQGLFKNLVA